MTIARGPLIGTVCILALSVGAGADYTLVPELTASGNLGACGRCFLGQSCTVDMVLYSDAEGVDCHTSAIFTVRFSQPGLQYDSYSWADPYATGGQDDFSDPANGDPPAPLGTDTYVAPSADPGKVDVYFENFVTGEEAFATGVLLSLSLWVPYDYPTGQIIVTAVPEALEGDDGPVPTTGGSLSMFITLCGDRDGNGFVGQTDLDIILDSWGQAVPPGDARADANGDGVIGQTDLDAVLDCWGLGSPPIAGGQHAPEPAAVAVLLAGSIGVLTKRRRLG